MLYMFLPLQWEMYIHSDISLKVLLLGKENNASMAKMPPVQLKEKRAHHSQENVHGRWDKSTAE